MRRYPASLLTSKHVRNLATTSRQYYDFYTSKSQAELQEMAIRNHRLSFESRHTLPLVKAKLRETPLSPKVTPVWSAPVMQYEQVRQLVLQPRPEILLIDVREHLECQQGMIPSAVNIPLSTLSQDIHLSAKDFAAKYGFERPGEVPHQQLIFYCRHGMRSASVADFYAEHIRLHEYPTVDKIWNYRGSWLEWVGKQVEEESDSLLQPA